MIPQFIINNHLMRCIAFPLNFDSFCTRTRFNYTVKLIRVFMNTIIVYAIIVIIRSIISFHRPGTNSTCSIGYIVDTSNRGRRSLLVIVRIRIVGFIRVRKPDLTLSRAVGTAEIQDQFTVNEDPYVIVPGEPELHWGEEIRDSAPCIYFSFGEVSTICFFRENHAVLPHFEGGFKLHTIAIIVFPGILFKLSCVCIRISCILLISRHADIGRIRRMLIKREEAHGILSFLLCPKVFNIIMTTVITNIFIHPGQQEIILAVPFQKCRIPLVDFPCAFSSCFSRCGIISRRGHQVISGCEYIEIHIFVFVSRCRVFLASFNGKRELHFRVHFADFGIQDVFPTEEVLVKIRKQQACITGIKSVAFGMPVFIFLCTVIHQSPAYRLIVCRRIGGASPKIRITAIKIRIICHRGVVV